ncbi:dTMP kinase [Latilactobacillus sp. 5-91]|uniref:dTMP kinase n=1 Tax=Latilactobacillus sp. 5-91 TaxID=3410924 RepID=UPI000CD6A621|nr:dTMP kinase [Latilactobacillus sakei]AUX12419.1 dTMP kinase [Latilactobacillus sakei]
MDGNFITFEGPDGAGKTSVLEAIVPKISSLIEQEIVVTREPGGNNISESIRNLILDIDNSEMDSRTEALLYAAARRQHIVERIQPALNRKAIVICDRFVDSSIAYQGAGRSIGEKLISDMNLFATDGLTPDLTIYLDVPSEVGLERIQKNRQNQYDRLDHEKLDFHKKVRKSYQNLMRNNTDRIKMIDATQPFSEVVDNCMRELLKFLDN